MSKTGAVEIAFVVDEHLRNAVEWMILSRSRWYSPR
jgi:hypothetical protein